MIHDCPKCGKPWDCRVHECGCEKVVTCTHCQTAELDAKRAGSPVQPVDLAGKPALDGPTCPMCAKPVFTDYPGKLTMLEALKYIHQDNRFWARPKGCKSDLALYWDRNAWHWTSNTPVVLPTPEWMFTEWEIVRPEQVRQTPNG